MGLISDDGYLASSVWFNRRWDLPGKPDLGTSLADGFPVLPP
jgi:hypothetical protein